MERLIPAGALPHFDAKDVAFSRLGVGFEKLDRDVFNPEPAYDLVAAIGVKRVRLQSGWMKTEKVEGVYDFAWLDRIVDNLIARGMEPWLCLCYGNPLYTELAKPVFGAVGCPPIVTEQEQNAWIAYVKATVEHFHGRIGLYEIWNEPDCNYSWRHCENEVKDYDKDAYEYGIFASATARAIKEVDSAAKVIGFALAHTRANGFSFAEIALSTGLYRYVDYVSYHSYSAHDEERCQRVKALQTLVQSFNPNIKLIQGESGCQSRSDGAGALKRMAWTEEKQQKLLLRILVRDLHCGVEFTSYFSSLDMVEALRGRLADKASYMDYGYFGVLRADFDENGRGTGNYTKKPSYYALSALASLMQGDVQPQHIAYSKECLPSVRVNGNDCTDSTVEVYGFRLEDGRRVVIYWNNVPILTSTYEGTVSLAIYGQKGVAPKVCDLRNGNLYDLPAEMWEKSGAQGVLLKNLPLTDCPIALIFD